MTLEILIDLEIGLVKAFGWSLHDIDETNVGSLIPFIGRLTVREESGSRRVYADEAGWL
jgi:hypothetical protein